MPVTESLTPFVGRSSELAPFAPSCTPCVPGRRGWCSSKATPASARPSLIEQLLDGETDLTVLRATGEPWEAYVAYGVIDQIMRVAGRQHRAPARRPGQGVPGRGAGRRRGLAARRAGRLEQKAPVAVVVDDAQWADMDSLRSRCCSRCGDWSGERVLVVLGHRAEDAQTLPDGLRRLAGGRTGTTMTSRRFPPADIHQLAHALGVRDFSVRAAQRLRAHTEGNALFVKTMLAELPERRWRTWDLPLPAPRAFAAEVQRKLEACSAPTRALVEAMAVLGSIAPVQFGGALAGVPDLVEALDEASVVELLRV